MYTGDVPTKPTISFGADKDRTGQFTMRNVLVHWKLRKFTLL